MKHSKKAVILFLLFACIMSVVSISQTSATESRKQPPRQEEVVGDKTEQGLVQKADNRVCTNVNGKMECARKTAKPGDTGYVESVQDR